MTTLELPLLRAVDVRRVTHEGVPYFLLRDPTHVAEGQLFVPQAYGPILAMLDGESDAAGIRQRLLALFGIEVEAGLVEELLAALDEAHMLENARSRRRRAAAVAEWRAAPFRPPALAGRGYPASHADLWQTLQEYLEEADAVEPAAIDWSQGVALLSPHIDYTRGSAVYAQIWKRAAQAAQEADVAVLLGTDHFGDDPITLTRQHYATPYGTLPTDQGVIDALVEVLGEDAAFAGELRHRGEHSLELVAAWLHHMRAGEPLPVVPILTGSLHRFVMNGSAPAEDTGLDQLLAALRAATAGRRVLYVASGDLAHVGPAFGGAPLDAAGLEMIRDADSRLLRPLEQGDADAFFAEIKRVQNRNNVCGVAPIYLALRLLGTVRGEAAGYAVCPADESGTSIVTVAGMLFQR